MPQRRSERRRILIFTASFGGASDSVADALRRYYRAHYPTEVEVRVVDFFEEFMPSLNVLAKFAYQQQAPFFPNVDGTFAAVSKVAQSNPVVQELERAGFQRARECLEEFRPAAVISTSFIAGGATAEIVSGRVPFTATVVADYAARNTWLHPGTDLYFVASREVREDLLVRGVPWEKVAESGVPIQEGFSASLRREACRLELGLSDRFTVLLTTAAGLASHVRDVAAGLAQSGVQIAAATGHNSQLRRRLESISQDPARLRVWGHTADMPKMMCAADVLVGHAGGSMVSEALAVGVPLVLYDSVPGQEIHNVDFLVNAGAALLSRDGDDVVDKVRFLSGHPERLAQIAINARALGRPFAAKTVCERVLAAIR